MPIAKKIFIVKILIVQLNRFHCSIYMHIRKNRSRVVFIPFTKDIHTLLLNEGCTHIGNRGFIPYDDYLKTICKVINGYALVGLMFDSDNNDDGFSENIYVPCGRGFTESAAPELVKITDADVMFPIRSERTKEMYFKPDAPFYLYINRTVEWYSVLYKKIKATFIRKQIFSKYRHSAMSR